MKFDLHIHSKYSFDSFSQPKKIVERAKRIGLDGIAVTDHNTIKGGLEVEKLTRGMDDFVGICGAEISTDHGDIIGLFLNEDIEDRYALNVIDRIKSQGGIVILPHPFKRTENISKELLKRIDAIEVFNARGKRPTRDSKNQRAMQLAERLDLPKTAGSDAHFLFEIGRGICDIEHSLDMKDSAIKKSILKSRRQIYGVESSLYVEQLSQMIRMIKLRRIDIFPKVIRNSVRITIFSMKNRISSVKPP